MEEDMATKYNKRFAIIGAGVSGAAATKALLDEGFTDVVVFEKCTYGHTFGLWRFAEKVDENGTGSVMRSTVISTSKEMSAISNFPPPASAPNYMHNTQNIEYYESWSKPWNYDYYIRFRCLVTSVEMALDHQVTGRWTVRYRNLENSEEHSEVYDGVAICVGHHNVRNEPVFKGQEKFRGRIMHTHSLKKAESSFEKKRCLVIGAGNSAADAAVELSTVAHQVYLSTRRQGVWLFPRVVTGGLPFDTFYMRRWLDWLRRLLPYWLVCTFIEWTLNDRVDHELYQLKPKHRALSSHPTMNDQLPYKIICGRVKVKGDIDHFEEEGVVFKGETAVVPVDVVVLGTGYKVAIPFLSQEILPIEGNNARLFKFMFIPGTIPHSHTLGILGLFQTVGAGLPAVEMQARWFALLQSGKRRLPKRRAMEADIDRVKREIAERYYEAGRHTFQTDWLQYMDELAAQIGCAPPLLKYLFTDPLLFYHLVFKISVPYQYRLIGPNAWAGARTAILTVDERIAQPFKTNAARDEKASRWGLDRLNIKEVLSICIFLAAVYSAISIGIVGKIFSS